MTTADLRKLVDRARTADSWLTRWRLRRRLLSVLLRVIDPVLDELERLRADAKLADEVSLRKQRSAWDRGFFAGQHAKPGKPPKNPY